MQLKDGKKLIHPHSIVSTIDLTTMFINSICDSYDEPEYKGTKRTLLRFHRKLAPYSISFAIAGGGGMPIKVFLEQNNLRSVLVAANISELTDLALYLTKQLRTNHVSTLFLPSSSKLSLEAQWRQYDELGVPYNVLLNEKTLKDGLALLRSRDTTLKVRLRFKFLLLVIELKCCFLQEQVHVTELVSYVEQLLKNY